VQLHSLKLVTIVAEQVLLEQITTRSLELGATGCTWSESKGQGSRGARRDEFSGNVRIELICPPPVAESILTFVSHSFFEHYACIAWVTDVSVVRGARYVKSS
jgi:nitrogen regulatory protein P-II 2